MSFTDYEEISTITSDDETEFIEAIQILNKIGGTIYIDTPVINCIERNIIEIEDDFPGGIIGIRQSNGEYPRINFIKGGVESYSGVIIIGSNKYIKYIIIENVPDNGVSIIGNNNILDHVISRYNYGSGFAIYGDFNIINYCYSYRNFDIDIYLDRAHGFFIYGEINNTFNYCFAWDNANCGFRSVRGLNTSEISYLHSGSWNNGNINVFTGKYDYDNGKPLDKNLWTVQEIIKSDPNFISNYYNKKYNIDDAKLSGFTVKEWISKVIPRLGGDGFYFGMDVIRIVLYCISFDNISGGFTDNLNHKYNEYITNTVSFNNGINYKLPLTPSKWTNNWSWGSKNPDQLNNDKTSKKPSNTNNAQRSVYSVRDEIIKAVTANMFPDGINFDNTISKL